MLCIYVYTGRIVVGIYRWPLLATNRFFTRCAQLEQTHNPLIFLHFVFLKSGPLGNIAVTYEKKQSHFTKHSQFYIGNSHLGYQLNWSVRLVLHVLSWEPMFLVTIFSSFCFRPACTIFSPLATPLTQIRGSYNLNRFPITL